MLERIYWLLEIISLAICISSIYGVKIKADIKTVVWIAIEVTFMGMLDREVITTKSYFVIYVLYILYVYIKFKKPLKTAIFTAILSMIFTGLIQMIIALPVYYIGDYCKASENIMVLVINTGVLMAVVLISRTEFLYGVYKFLARKELILNITFILVMFIYGYCMYRIKDSNKIQSDLYVIIVTFASIIACILLRWKEMERETKYQQEQIKLSNRYSEEYNALVEISRKKQHDFKNQINALYGLSDIKAEKEQRKYIDKLLDENKVVKILHSVEQPVLAGFLYRKVNEIMAAGINIEFNLSVPDTELAIEVLDCIEIVGIFLDNAVEALSKEKDKSIILEMFAMEQKVEIRVKNVSPYYENDEIAKFFQHNYSTKGKNRGIGLAKIKDLQKKYKFDILVEMQEIHNKNWISFSVIK